VAELHRASVAGWERHLGGPVDPAALRAELAAGSLPEAFAATAGRRGDAPALEIDGRAASHAELDACAARAAGALRERGLEPGDRVLLAGPSSLELVTAYLGILRAGATAVPADPRLTAGELAHLLGDAEPAAAVAAAPVRDLLAEAGEGPSLVVALEADAGTGPRVADLLDGPPLPAGPADAPAMLAYTSGTTGRPKGALLSHGNVLSSIRAAMRAWRWREDDVLVHALPLSHQHGLSGVHATLLAGSRAVINSAFDPERLEAALDGASVLFAVPAIYERLAFERPPRLRLAVSGSAPLPPRLAERLADRLGELPLERYGSTEAGLDLSNLYDGPRRAGAVGFPLPGVEARLGENDELLVRGPQVFGGYRGRPDATAEALDADGWFRTGDLAAADDDGCFTITGRLKELIVSGGLNVYPAEVEQALETHPAVARAAVAGVPSERWGEEVVAFAVAAGGDLDADALIAHCRERLSAYKCPKRVVALRELPVNRMGKVQRDRLAELGAREHVNREKGETWTSR
jgi:malonyl-CoA/methylmalonyl-CoA synthetase